MSDQASVTIYKAGDGFIFELTESRMSIKVAVTKNELKLIESEIHKLLDKEHTTHDACAKRVRQEGGKAKCCYESNHSHCEFRKKRRQKDEETA